MTEYDDFVDIVDFELP